MRPLWLKVRALVQPVRAGRHCVRADSPFVRAVWPEVRVIWHVTGSLSTVARTLRLVVRVIRRHDDTIRLLVRAISPDVRPMWPGMQMTWPVVRGISRRIVVVRASSHQLSPVSGARPRASPAGRAESGLISPTGVGMGRGILPGWFSTASSCRGARSRSAELGCANSLYIQSRLAHF